MIAPLIVLLALFGPSVLALWMARAIRRDEEWFYWVEQDCKRLDCRIRNARASGENIATLCMMRAIRHTQRDGWV